MQKLVVFGLTLNPKQGVLRVEGALSFAPVMFSPRPAARAAILAARLVVYLIC